MGDAKHDNFEVFSKAWDFSHSEKNTNNPTMSSKLHRNLPSLVLATMTQLSTESNTGD